MYPLKRTDHIYIEQLASEAVVYDRTSHQAHCLNETAFTIWEAADGTKSVEQLAEVLHRKFNAHFTQDVVLLALEDLKKANLLLDPIDSETQERPSSRRDIARKLALAGASASFLPFISSIVAPTAAMARSYNSQTYASEWAGVQSEAKNDWGQLLTNKNNSLTDYRTALSDGTTGIQNTLQGKTSLAQTDFEKAETEFDDMLNALGLPPL